MGYVKNTRYYRDTVFEFNLPTGTTCPFAKECKVVVDRASGKFDVSRGQYRCYAASPERFPAVRDHRWNNFEQAKAGTLPDLPKKCRAVRIHASGDFFNQEYFDLWLDYIAKHPTVEFWAYTKSITYWVNRIDRIPSNLILTASYGGRQDHLISEHHLKNVKVYSNVDDVPSDRPIDTNDNWARTPDVSFALLDNMKYSKKAYL